MDRLQLHRRPAKDSVLWRKRCHSLFSRSYVNACMRAPNSLIYYNLKLESRVHKRVIWKRMKEQPLRAWLWSRVDAKWAVFPLRLDIIGSGGACAEGLAGAKLSRMGRETSMQYGFRSDHPKHYFWRLSVNCKHCLIQYQNTSVYHCTTEIPKSGFPFIFFSHFMKSNKIQHPNMTNTSIGFNIQEGKCRRNDAVLIECTGCPTVKLLQELKKQNTNTKENLIFWITKYFLHMVW